MTVLLLLRLTAGSPEPVNDLECGGGSSTPFVKPNCICTHVAKERKRMDSFHRRHAPSSKRYNGKFRSRRVNVIKEFFASGRFCVSERTRVMNCWQLVRGKWLIRSSYDKGETFVKLPEPSQYAWIVFFFAYVFVPDLRANNEIKRKRTLEHTRFKAF